MISLAAFCYWLMQLIIELKKRNFVGEIFKSFSEKYEQRQIEQAAEELYNGAVEKNKFIDKADSLVKTSGLNNIFRNITGELLIALTLILALIITVVVHEIFNFWLFDITAFSLTVTAVFFILEFRAKKIFDGIDQQLLTYINVLKNLSASNEDIVIIFEKSLPYVRQPLKQHIMQFIYEAKKGIPLKVAFKNFEKAVDNNRFKQLLRNLYIASKHDANYREVLRASKSIFKHYFTEKKRRQITVRNGRIGILVIVILGLSIFKLADNFISGGILTQLRNTTGGNIILGYFLAIFIYTIYKFITLDKLNY